MKTIRAETDYLNGSVRCFAGQLVQVSDEQYAALQKETKNFTVIESTDDVSVIDVPSGPDAKSKAEKKKHPGAPPEA